MLIFSILLLWTPIQIVSILTSYFTANFFGVKVKKVTLLLDFRFNLFKIKIKGTEFIIGWLPINSSILLQGRNELDDYFKNTNNKLLPNDFDFQSPIKRLAILISGPISTLFFGIILFGLYDINTSVMDLILQIIFVFIGTIFLYLLLKILYKYIYLRFFKHSKKISQILILFIYLHFLGFMLITINTFFPFNTMVEHLFLGTYNLNEFTNSYIQENSLLIISSICFFSFIVNIFVFASGLDLLVYLYEDFSNDRIKTSSYDGFSFFSIFFSLAIYIWIFIQFIIKLYSQYN